VQYCRCVHLRAVLCGTVGSQVNAHVLPNVQTLRRLLVLRRHTQGDPEVHRQEKGEAQRCTGKKRREAEWCTGKMERRGRPRSPVCQLLLPLPAQRRARQGFRGTTQHHY